MRRVTPAGLARGGAVTAAGLAFPLLALTAGATVAQSLRMGPYVAALGLAGTFVVPLLVVAAAAVLLKIRWPKLPVMERRLVLIGCGIIGGLLVWVPTATPATLPPVPIGGGVLEASSGVRADSPAELTAVSW